MRPARRATSPRPLRSAKRSNPSRGSSEGEREADGPRGQGADEEDHEHGQEVRREPAQPGRRTPPASFGSRRSASFLTPPLCRVRAHRQRSRRSGFCRDELVGQGLDRRLHFLRPALRGRRARTRRCGPGRAAPATAAAAPAAARSAGRRPRSRGRPAPRAGRGSGSAARPPPRGPPRRSGSPGASAGPHTSREVPDALARRCRASASRSTLTGSSPTPCGKPKSGTASRPLHRGPPLVVGLHQVEDRRTRPARASRRGRPRGPWGRGSWRRGRTGTPGSRRRARSSSSRCRCRSAPRRVSQTGRREVVRGEPAGEAELAADRLAHLAPVERRGSAGTRSSS